MTDIGNLIGRLHTIRDQLRTGAVGQREVWEEWLDEAIDELDQLFWSKAADEIDQLFWSKAALQTEIDRLRALNDDQQTENERLGSEARRWKDAEERADRCIADQRKIIEGTERREAEYLALIEKHATEVERLTAQLPDDMKHCTIQFKECEKGHGRLTAMNWIDHGCPHCEIERLKAERHTTKRMLKDILDKHGYSGWDAARTME